MSLRQRWGLSPFLNMVNEHSNTCLGIDIINEYSVIIGGSFWRGHIRRQA